LINVYYVLDMGLDAGTQWWSNTAPPLIGLTDGWINSPAQNI
jgi:hypothetical protein